MYRFKERTNHCFALPSSRCWEWLLLSATPLLRMPRIRSPNVPWRK